MAAAMAAASSQNDLEAAAAMIDHALAIVDRHGLHDAAIGLDKARIAIAKRLPGVACAEEPFIDA